MTSTKKFRRKAVRRLKSAIAMCFLSLLHHKSPHDGCPSEYNHTTRMSESFESRRSSRMPGSFDTQRMSSVYGGLNSQRASNVYGAFNPQRISNVYGIFDSQRTSNVYGPFDPWSTRDAYGTLDTPRVSRVYGGYKPRRASGLICECHHVYEALKTLEPPCTGRRTTTPCAFSRTQPLHSSFSVGG